MNPGSPTRDEDEVDLRDYTIIVLRKWWLVSAILAMVFVVTWVTKPGVSIPIYETIDKTMLVATRSDTLIGRTIIGGSDLLPASVTMDSLLKLGTGNNLMMAIIASRGLNDPSTGA